MRTFLTMAALLPLLAAAAPAEKSATRPAGATACDVTLDVTDPDPKGLNVRAAPSPQGAVVAVLRPEGEWTQVHVAGQQGDWLWIDGAEVIDDNAPDGSRPGLARPGWVHASKVGPSELFTGEGTVLHDRPAADGKVLERLRDEDTASVRILGCKGRYIHVVHGRIDGWTDRWCNNQRTTCS